MLRTLIALRSKTSSIVTGRLLPRRLGLDAGNKVRIRDEVFEEAVPVFG